MVTVALRRIDPGARRARWSTSSTRPASTSCRTPPAATRRATRCSPRSSPARRSRPTGSSSRSSATSARCCPTRPSCWPPPRSSSPTASRPALHDRRPGPRPPPGGRRLRGDHAAGLADRQRHGHPQPVQPRADPRADRAAGDPRRRRRHRVATPRWRWSSAATASSCASAISRAQDPVAMARGDPRRRRGRPARPRRRPHPAPALRRGLDPARRACPDLVLVNDAARRLRGGVEQRRPGAPSPTSARPTSTTRTRSLREPAAGSPTRSATTPRRLWAGFPDARIETHRRAPDRRPLRRRAGQAARHAPQRARGPPADRPRSWSSTSSSTASSTRRASACGGCARSSTSTTPAQQLGVLPAHGGLGERALLMLRGFGLNSVTVIVAFMSGWSVQT